MNKKNENLYPFSNIISLSLKVTDKGNSILDDTISYIKEINLNSSRLAIPIQKHTDNVVWTTNPGKFEKCDGIVSNLNYNLILSLSVADCVPICIFDEVTGNFGLIHSGWRGTLSKIAINAVNLLMDNGSKIKDINVYFGHSISQKNYEVDIDVASLFSESSYIKHGKKYLLDIKNQIKQDLVQIGLKPNQISQSSRCTYNDTNFPSYRRDGSKSGRLIFLMRKNND